MHFAYVDESGDFGAAGSVTYTLGCVLVEDRVWPGALDELIEFRRLCRQRLSLPVRAEVKANHLIRNAGAFRALRLNEKARRRLYRDHLRLHAQLGLWTFAILVHKQRTSTDPRVLAWDYLLQRLERFSTKGQTQIAVVHDEGDHGLIRKLHRRARRAGVAGSMFGTGALRRPAVLFVEDPVPRRSSDSYFIQLADLTAYAAYRRIYPPPAAVRTAVVPQTMWDTLGSAVLRQVNMYSGGPPGIVQAP